MKNTTPHMHSGARNMRFFCGRGVTVCFEGVDRIQRVPPILSRFSTHHLSPPLRSFSYGSRVRLRILSVSVEGGKAEKRWAFGKAEELSFIALEETSQQQMIIMMYKQRSCSDKKSSKTRTRTG